MSSRGGRAAECPVSMPIGRVGDVDPPPELARLAEEQPICRVRLLNGESGWLVTSYELSRAVLGDSRFSARRIWGRQPAGELEQWLAGGIEDGTVPPLNETDPPDHARRRQVVESRLTFDRVQSMRGRVRSIIDRALDELERAGPPADFMERFARPVSALVVGDVVGVSPDDEAVLLELARRIRDPRTAPEEPTGGLPSLRDHLEDLVAGKRRDPGDDLISDMIRRGSLTDEELVRDAIDVLRAGYEKTSTQLAYGLFALLSRPARWAALARSPESVGGVVEELLRYLTIVDVNPTERTASQDVEIGGMMVLAGETLVVSLLAGDRDPDRFPDPDEFRPDRDARGHLAFGGGVHLCVGQHLARLQLTLGFTELARRFPDLRLACDVDPVRWLPDDHHLSGPSTLQVAW